MKVRFEVYVNVKNEDINDGWSTQEKKYDFVFFFFQAEDGIRDRDVTGADVCSSDLMYNVNLRRFQ